MVGTSENVCEARGLGGRRRGWERDPLSSSHGRQLGPLSEAAPSPCPQRPPRDGRGAGPSAAQGEQKGHRCCVTVRNTLEISIFDPIEIMSGFCNGDPSHFAGLRHTSLSPLLCSRCLPSTDPPLPHDVLALFE